MHKEPGCHELHCCWVQMCVLIDSSSCKCFDMMTWLSNICSENTKRLLFSFLFLKQSSPVVKALEDTAELAELFFGCGDWCTVRGTFVWTFNAPPAVPPVVPLYRGLKQTWHPEHLGDFPYIYDSTFLLHPLPFFAAPFSSKNNIGEFFIVYIASVSPCRVRRVARDGGWQAHSPRSARRQAFCLVCLPNSPVPFYCPVFLKSQTFS